MQCFIETVHAPPHFHAIYGEYEITVEIESGIINGRFPKRALKLIFEWLELHREELLENWRLAEDRRPLNKIEPLEQTMTPRIVEAKYAGDYTLFLRFSDGTEGEINFEQELTGEIFEPLKDIEYFKKFILNHEIHTIVWPNGADFSPEFLYENIRILS